MSAWQPGDEALLARLRQREREEERQARQDAARLEEGPCPACGTALQPQTSWLLPWRGLVERPALRCSKCGLEAPPRPNRAGRWVAGAVGTALVLAGLSVVLSVQETGRSEDRLYAFLTGGALFACGMMVFHGTSANGGAPEVGAQLVHRRRQRERGERPGPPRPPASTWVNEIVFTAVLYLLVRQFAMEAFVIPTGSMAPTLVGNHYRVECPRCHYPFSVGRRDGDFSRSPLQTVPCHCPLCRASFEVDRAAGDVESGSKIMVNKFLYKVRPPRRFEVVVFRFPSTPWVNYIKRVVGLPGDVIEVKNGDLYVDGELVRKPDDVQDAIWIPVWDAHYAYPEAGLDWRVVSGRPWEIDMEGQAFQARPQAEEQTWLELGPGVVDRYGYNRDLIGNEVPVPDLRVTATVVAAAGAFVRLAAVDDFRVVTGRVALAEDSTSYALEVDGRVVLQAEQGPRLRPGQPVELALSYADERVRLLVRDGALGGWETVLAWEDTSAPPPGQATERATVRLGASGGEVRFSAVRVDRDIHYVPSRGRFDPTRGPVRIPEGSYFMMGDNSPNSEDSRVWGFVREGHLLGRAFLVWYPLGDLGIVR